MKSNLDKVFEAPKFHKYKCFYDREGIINGVWVLFRKRGEIAFKILQDNQVGDIVLALDLTNHVSSLDERNLLIKPDEVNKESIVGFAIPVQENVILESYDEIGMFVESWLEKISIAIINEKIGKKTKHIFKYLANKVSECDLIISEGMSFQSLVSLQDSNIKERPDHYDSEEVPF